jgi:Fe2+ or Zn2+ uptake regulation protein
MKKEKENKIHTLLDKAGLKRTKGRVAVLGVLLSKSKPLTIEEIEKGLSIKIHMVTLYRMLRQFVQKNIVYQTDLRTGKAYYELQQEHHHHIVCTVCGVQEEVKACITNLQKNIQKEAKHFDTIDTHSLEFFGVCTKCT